MDCFVDPEEDGSGGVVHNGEGGDNWQASFPCDGGVEANDVGLA